MPADQAPVVTRAPATLTVRAIRCVGVEVPMTYALGTSRGTITKAPLLLIDLETEEGVTGRSYLWCYFPAAMPAIASILGEAERTLKGETVAPVELWARLAERFALIGVQGIVRMAMSGVDMRRLGRAGARTERAAGHAGRQHAQADPGLQLLRPRPDGARARSPTKPRSCSPAASAPSSSGSVTRRSAEDLAALHAVRKRVGEAVAIMVDYNQALGLADALARGRALDSEGIAWLEEPIRHDDYAGYAALVRELNVPIQLGENFSLARRHGDGARGRRQPTT